MMYWKLPETKSFDAILDQLPEKYTLSVEMEGCEKISIWDDFDHHILRSGYVLAWVNKKAYQLSYGLEPPVVWPSARPIRFAQALPASEFQKCLSSLVSVRLLEPIYEASFQRQVFALRNSDNKAVLKMHYLVSDNLSVLMLRPIRGYEKAASQMIEILQKAGAEATQQSLPALIFSCSGVPVSTYSIRPDIKLDPEMPARQIVPVIALEMIRIARLNEFGMLHKGEDTEFLHDYRVCLRKVRSLINLLKAVFPAEKYDELKLRLGDLFRKTNRLRDLDVYLLDQDKYERALPESLQPGVVDLFQDFTQQQKKARRSLKRWLQSDGYQADITALLNAVQSLDELPEQGVSHQPLKQVVAKLARKRFNKIRQIGMRIHADTPDEEVHELRIECKKFRYLLDFFGDLFESENVSELSNRLRKLQNTLGKFNDFSVQQEALLQYMAQQNRHQALSLSVGALIQVMSQGQKKQRSRVEKLFQEFSDERTLQLAKALFARSEADRK